MPQVNPQVFMKVVGLLCLLLVLGLKSISATENEQLVLSSPRQQELDFKDPSENPLRSARSTNGTLQETAYSSEASEPATIAVPTSPPPLLSMATPPLIQMSPPPPCDFPSEICPSLFDLPPLAKENTVMPDSRIGELGKRRGFKGAPLFTPETAKKPSASFRSFSSALSPNTPFSSSTPRVAPFTPSTPRTARPKTPLSPSTPRTARPSTPRTPLATVTNLLRTPTLKSPKPPATLMECPVDGQLQLCYDLRDPFSALGHSFYDPEIVCASVPFSNLDMLRVYRRAPSSPARSHKTFFKAVEAASRTKPRIRDTNVYDTMVYSYEAKQTSKKAGRKLPRVSNSTEVGLPPDIQPNGEVEVSPQDLGLRPVDICAESLPNTTGPPHEIVIDTLPTTLDAATCDPQGIIVDTRHTNATTYGPQTNAIDTPSTIFNAATFDSREFAVTIAYVTTTPATFPR